MIHNTTGFPNLVASNGLFLAVSIALPEKKKPSHKSIYLCIYIHSPSVIKNKIKKSAFSIKDNIKTQASPSGNDFQPKKIANARYFQMGVVHVGLS